MAKKLKEGYYVGKGEKWSYALYILGENIFYALVALNIQTFFSDVGITAVSVASILFITKVWDAINDPLFGVILDKIRFKKGRFLPWIRIAVPLIGLSSIFLFMLPVGMSPVPKMIWAVIGYIAWDMSFTLSDVPCFVLPSSMTGNIKERTDILAFGRFFALIGTVAGSMVLPIVQARAGWMMTGVVISVISMLIMLPICFTAKERNIVRSEKDVSLKEMIHFVAKNKYLLIFYVGMFISQMSNFAQAMNIFFARYNLGNQDLASLFGLIGMVPMLLSGAIAPLLVKKIDKFKVFYICSIITAVISATRYFVGYNNLVVYVVFNSLQSLFSGITSVLLYMFTPDCTEYGTYHTGERADGVAVSVQTFFIKLTGSVSGPLAMLIVGFFGFVSGENAVQPQSALTGIWLCMSLLPAIGMVIAILAWSRYKLRDKDVQIMAEYNSGKISKQEAEEKLADKFGPAADLSNITVTQG